MGEVLRSKRFPAGTHSRETEIEDLHHALRGDLDIRGLQVPMDDTFFVRSLERQCDLIGDPEGLIKSQRTPQRFAVHQFHHQIVRAHIVEVTDVRVVEGRDREGFPLEALVELLASCLHRDCPVQPGVTRSIDLTHAAFTNQGDYFIGAEARSRGERHGV